MARAMQAIMAQAGAWLTSYKSDLTARGLGFSPDDLAAIAASATAHPLPAGHTTARADGEPSSEDMQRVQKMAIETVYPEHGFPPDDPRLAPVGMPLVAWAVAARAIGWANEDPRSSSGWSRHSATPAPTTTPRLGALDADAEDRHGGGDALRPALRPVR